MVAAVGSAALALSLLAGCSSEDVTGEPEDIGELVHVVAAGSDCVHDAGADRVTFRVHLADGELTVDAAPDDLESCAVRIDSEDDVPVARRTAPG